MERVEGVGGHSQVEQPSHLCLKMAGLAAGVLKAIETRDEETYRARKRVRGTSKRS
tara:strand:+ start:343 stop:510 length:168 start_codon:yes stop_codon:yes gene_type:complete